MCVLPHQSAVFATHSPGGSRSHSYRGSQNTRISGISRWLNALGRGGDPAFHDTDEDEEDDEDDDYDYHHYAPFGTVVGAPWKGPETTEPQNEGVELLNSGDFGRVGNKARTRRNCINLANLILNRSRHPRPVSNMEDYAAVRIHPSMPYYLIP